MLCRSFGEGKINGHQASEPAEVDNRHQANEKAALKNCSGINASKANRYNGVKNFAKMEHRCQHEKKREARQKEREKSECPVCIYITHNVE